MGKYKNKNPLFKIGDIVHNLRDTGTVKLFRRWDNDRTEEVSWLVTSLEYPDVEPFALIEDDMKKVS